jgi:subtilisin family serine protease
MRKRRTWAVGAVGAIAAATLIISQWGYASPRAQAAEHPNRAVTPVRAQPVRSAQPQWLTLVTGDQVEVRTEGESVRILRTSGRPGMHFVQQEGAGQTYLLPADALSLVASGRVDRRLFDVTELLRSGYGDRSRAELPVIVGYASRTAQPSVRSRWGGGTRVRRSLSAVDSDAVLVPKSGAAAFWKSVATGANLATGVSRLWLDAKVHASLDKSVPQIGAPQAWAAGYTGQGVTVAVLDTGIDRSHPDLAGAVTAAQDFTGSESGTADKFGHGTHVAGIITGSGAASGGRYVGVAPDAKLLNGKVLDDNGYGEESTIIAGIDWAVAQGARIVNLSLSGDSFDDGTDPLDEAVDRQSQDSGTLFVVAAGNAGPRSGQISSPAAADAALTVGAVDKQDALADFSSRGPRPGDAAVKPDITAPGVDIVSALAAGSVIAASEPVVDGQYVSLSGTSMATPHVAGSAALLAGEHPQWTGTQLKAVLMGSAKPGTGLTVYQQGAGRVDVARAVTQPVYTTPASVNDGIARWPHTDDQPIDSTVTYHNDGAAPLELTVSAQVLDPAGAPAPAGMFTVDRPTVTVPPHGTAGVHLTADTTVDAPDGTYGGVLVATGGPTAVRTPVGVTREVKSHTVTVRLRDRTGTPASDYQLRFVNVAAPQVLVPYDASGSVSVRVPDGTYSVEADINTPNPQSPWGADLSVAAEPQVSVGADRTLTFDARSARPVGFTVDRSEARNANVYVQLLRTISWSDGVAGHSLYGPADGLFVRPTDTKPPAGEFTYSIDAWYARPDGSGGFTGSPYFYQLHREVAGKVPSRLVTPVHDGDLAEVRQRIAANRPDESALVASMVWLAVPATVTEYASPGVPWADSVEFYSSGADPDAGTLDSVRQSEPVTYQRGPATRQWNAAVFGPAFNTDAVSLRNDNADLARSGDDIVFGPGPALYSGAGENGDDQTGTQDWTLARDGMVLGELTFTAASHGGHIPVPASPGTYHLSVVQHRPGPGLSTVVSTEWTFASSHPATDADQVLPLLAVGFAPALDQYNSTGVTGGYAFPVHVSQQFSATGYGQLDRLSVDVSYDDGKTWRPATVTGSGSDRTVTVDQPAGPGYASLRATTTDSAGNAVTESVIRAYALT